MIGKTTMVFAALLAAGCGSGGANEATAPAPAIASEVVSSVPDEKPPGVQWTKTPRAADAPDEPLHGQFAGKAFVFSDVKFVRGGGVDWRLEATAAHGSVELTLPLSSIKPEMGSCIARPMRSSIDGRLTMDVHGNRSFSNVFAYGLSIEEGTLVPFRSGKHPIDGLELGRVSGRLFATFDKGLYGAEGPGWVAGTFKNARVLQHRDRGEIVPCTTPPTASGMVRGALGKTKFTFPGVRFEEAPATDTDPHRWLAEFFTTPLDERNEPQRILAEKGAMVMLSQTLVPFDRLPAAGLCLQQTADYVIDGPTLALEALAWKLSFTSYEPAHDGEPGKASGVVYLDWREGSTIAGSFTDAPVIPLREGETRADAPGACAP